MQERERERERERKMCLMKFTEVRERKELKSDGRKWRGEGKQKRKQDNQ